jgi:hypothetical protein
MSPPSATRAERPFAHCRREAGLDLHAAAVRLRVHPRYLRSLELSHGPLSLDLAHRMAREYGVPLNDLIRPARSGHPSGTGGTERGREANGNVSRPGCGRSVRLVKAD